jgi:hypothetical protein
MDVHLKKLMNVQLKKLLDDIHHFLLLNYEEVEIHEVHQQLYDVRNFLNLIMEDEVEVVVVEVQMEDYQLLLYHLLLNHFSFQLMMLLNEDMDRHDAKILFLK